MLNSHRRGFITQAISFVAMKLQFQYVETPVSMRRNSSFVAMKLLT